MCLARLMKRQLTYQIIALESFLHNPIFVFPVVNGGDNVACLSFNFSAAILRVMTSAMSCEGGVSGGKTLSDMSADAKEANRCVVLFAEGVRTNGDGVLRFPAEVGEDNVCIAQHSLALELNKPVFLYLSSILADICPSGEGIGQ